MTYIKFCGITREQDLATAVELGVSAVGFVLWPRSPRHVDVARVAGLVRMLPPAVVPVGVFVSPARDEIDRAIGEAGIRVAQVHGASRTPLEDLGCEVWIAASLSEHGDMVPHVVEELTVLLDAHDPARHGGTGRTVDWSHAASVAAKRRVMLAGGLTPTNVADAVRRVRPFGVDVASGIEVAPGVKDPDSMRAFVAAVRKADS